MMMTNARRPANRLPSGANLGTNSAKMNAPEAINSHVDHARSGRPNGICQESSMVFAWVSWARSSRGTDSGGTQTLHRRSFNLLTPQLCGKCRFLRTGTIPRNQKPKLLNRLVDGRGFEP